VETEEIQAIETITPYEAGRILHKNAEFIRAGLRQNKFNFGVAVAPEKDGGDWNYLIIKSKFLAFAGINRKEEKA